MQPKKIILIVAILLVVFLLFYFFLLENKSQLSIKTPSGNIQINNPAKLPDKKPLSMNGVNFKDNPNYSIDYYPQDQGFIIAISSPDIQTARSLAEKDLLETLGINQEDACKLKITLSVPFRVNEKASGTNYGLSFCPNGKAFPK